MNRQTKLSPLPCMARFALKNVANVSKCLVNLHCISGQQIPKFHCRSGKSYLIDCKTLLLSMVVIIFRGRYAL